MFKYSVAIIAALAFMGLGCSNVSSKTFRPRTVEIGVAGGQTDYSERSPVTSTTTTQQRGRHNRTVSETVGGGKLNGEADSWSVGGSVGWRIIYKDEEKARERSD
jgi:hypothetical protein